jgi:glyoxylase-like metal-dependent hydrolase (beta-lactamase superfamily II)
MVAARAPRDKRSEREMIPVSAGGHGPHALGSWSPMGGDPVDLVDLGPRPIRVLAPNPGPFTLEGTNTWIVGCDPSLVVDPGPDDPGHLAAVLRQAAPVAAILLTHRHPDHAPGAAELARLSGAPVRAFRPEPSEERLGNGQTVEGGCVSLRVVHTPGHAPDHVVFHDVSAGVLFTGDAVLGRGTSVVDPEDGDMRAYLRSLTAMAALRPRVLYPGHGPVVWAAGAKLAEYVEHRRRREAEILAALGEGAKAPEELVAEIYRDVPSELHALAARSVLAHLLKLEADHRVVRAGARADDRFSLASPTECAGCGRPVVRGGTLCDRCRLAALQEGPPMGGPARRSTEASEEAP